MMKVKKIASFGITVVIALTIVYFIFSDWLMAGEEGEDISAEDNFKQLIKTENSFLLFYTKPNEKLNEIWRDVSSTVKKDYENVRVSKFDCSVFRPICEGIGIHNYPSIVWMKSGKVVREFNGLVDEELLKSFVFDMMKSTNDETQPPFDIGDDDIIDVSEGINDVDVQTDTTGDIADESGKDDEAKNVEDEEVKNIEDEEVENVENEEVKNVEDEKFNGIDDAAIDKMIEIEDNTTSIVENDGKLVDGTKLDDNNSGIILDGTKDEIINDNKHDVSGNAGVMEENKPNEVNLVNDNRTAIIAQPNLNKTDSIPLNPTTKSVVIPSTNSVNFQPIQNSSNINQVSNRTVIDLEEKSVLKLPPVIVNPSNISVPSVQPPMKPLIRTNLTTAIPESSEDDLLGARVNPKSVDNQNSTSSEEDDDEEDDENESEESHSLDVDKLLKAMPPTVKPLEKKNNESESSSEPLSIEKLSQSESEDESDNAGESNEDLQDQKNIDIGDMIKNAKEEDEYFIEFTANNFERKVLKEGVTVLMMYADWCEKCDEIRKDMTKLAHKHSDNDEVQLGQIDCMKKKNEEFCLQNQMQGVPTINVYRNGKLFRPNLMGFSKSEIEDCMISHLTDDGIKKWNERIYSRAKKHRNPKNETVTVLRKGAPLRKRA